MRKIFKSLSIVMLLFVGMSFVSCEKKDALGDSMSGLYYYEYDWCYRDAYHFIQKNTVVRYSHLTRDYGTTWGDGIISIPFEERDGWYRCTYANKTTLTYYIVENKIFMSDGDILTIVGDILIREGSGNEFRIWE